MFSISFDQSICKWTDCLTLFEVAKIHRQGKKSENPARESSNCPSHSVHPAEDVTLNAVLVVTEKSTMWQVLSC